MTKEPYKKLIVATAQLSGSGDINENISRIEAMVEDAAGKGADLVIFPEAVMYDYLASGAELSEIALQYSSFFEGELCRIASRFNLTIVAGVYGVGESGFSKNLLVVTNHKGEVSARYEKLHLYNAFNFCESDKHNTAPLKPDYEELVVIGVKGVNFGLVNCYDLRFPEMPRLLIDKGADCLIVASGWVSGPLKELQWETLLKARAIENTCFVIASCQPAPRSTGLSMIVDPMGATVAGVADCEGLAVAEIDMERQANVRKILPCLMHRRYSIIQSK